jgi:aspartyl protease family protein
MIALALILFAAGVLIATHGQQDLAGLAPDDFAALAAFGAIGLLMASWIVSEFRGRWIEGFQALVVWSLVLLGLVGLYTYRIEVQEVAARVMGEIAPGRATVTESGEVVISRGLDGSFTIRGRIDENEARFIFDTGASLVVLTAETAAAVGLRPSAGAYTVPVFTANGATMAAAITIDRLTVGSIVERRVRALVARPGALRENLLGMSFLERLTSYEVRGSRLFLRGRTTG